MATHSPRSLPFASPREDVAPPRDRAGRRRWAAFHFWPAGDLGAVGVGHVGPRGRRRAHPLAGSHRPAPRVSDTLGERRGRSLPAGGRGAGGNGVGAGRRGARPRRAAPAGVGAHICPGRFRHPRSRTTRGAPPRAFAGRRWKSSECAAAAGQVAARRAARCCGDLLCGRPGNHRRPRGRSHFAGRIPGQHRRLSRHDGGNPLHNDRRFPADGRQPGVPAGTQQLWPLGVPPGQRGSARQCRRRASVAGNCPASRPRLQR